VARKLQTTDGSSLAAATAAIHLRMAAKRLNGARVLQRARKIQIPAIRRRLPVKMAVEVAKPVKIGHSPQNFDTPVTEAQPAQTQHV
jgi:hypothetical protein